MSLAASLLVSAMICSPPADFVVQGQLTSVAGVPVDGAYGMALTLWDAEVGGTAKWSDDLLAVPVEAGVFSVVAAGIPIEALTADGGLWLGIQIANEPELPRQPLRATPYAMVAATSLALSCTGCVGVGALSADVSELIQAAAEAGYTDGEAVAAVVAADLFYAKDGQAAILADLLPADGLDEVSGGLISTTFEDVFASADTPKPIKDQYPLGTTSTISVPNVGIAKSFEVTVFVSEHSDVSELTVTLFSPQAQEILLYQKGNPGAPGFELTWPTEAAAITGDLSTYVGTNIQGDWHLKIVDDTFDTNTDDGILQSWAIAITTLSNQKLQIHGDLYANQHQIKDLGAPSDPADATNKAYVDASFQDRVHTGAFEAVPAGGEVTVAHGMSTHMVFAQAWFRDIATGIWSQNGAGVAGSELGSGIEGAFTPTASTTLDSGTHQFSVVDIPSGVTITVTGTEPLVIQSTGPVNIAGALELSGKSGGSMNSCCGSAAGGAAGGGGGGAGGAAPYSGGGKAGTGPGAGHGGLPGGEGGGGGGGGHSANGLQGGTAGCDGTGGGAGGFAYSSLDAETLTGGSGGGGGGYGGGANSSGGGGGGGAGAVKIVAPTITISGAVTADGGNGGNVGNSRDGGGGGGGSGGAIWLVSGSVNVSAGAVSAIGGKGGATGPSCVGGPGGNGAHGRVRIDALSVTGTTAPPATLGDGAQGTGGSPLRVFQPDADHVSVQNLSFVPLDIQVLVIVP